MNKLIDNDLGKFFPPSGVFSGYALLVFGGVAVFYSPVLGVLLLLLGIVMGFTDTGIQIDAEKMIYRSYTRFFWFRLGTYKPLDGFCNVAVLVRNYVYEAFTRANSMQSAPKLVYDVCLLDSLHHTKLVVKHCENAGAARLEIEMLVGALGVNEVEYKPVMSQRTKFLRRRRNSCR